VIVLRPAAGVRGRSDELCFAPDGRALASGRVGRKVLVWTDFAAGARARLLKLPDGGGETRVGFAPDGTLLAANDQLFAFERLDRRPAAISFTPWDTLWFAVAPAGAQLIVAEKLRNRNASRITGRAAGDYRRAAWKVTVDSLIWSRPLFALGGQNFILIEYRRDPARGWQSHRVTRSCADGAELAASPPLVEPPDRIALSAERHLLALAVRDRIDLYPADGPCTRRASMKNDGRKHFTAIAFHPSGRYLGATSNDATVKLYETSTWEAARTFTWNIGRMRSIAFSPDGALAAAGSDSGKVVVWDVDL
jgi:WD40 repeat protein